MPVDDTTLNEVKAAIGRGEKARARDLLTRLLKTGQENPQYWLWMSAAVETNKERLYCLKEVLRRDPQNADALRGLALAGGLPADHRPGPAPLVNTAWQRIPPPGAAEKKSPPARQLIFAGVGILVLTLLVFVGLFGAGMLGRRPAASARPTLLATITSAVTASTTPTHGPTATAPTSGPTPLWMLLEATYTPTPVYVNTPHGRTEAYRSAMRAFERGEWAGMLQYLQQVATSEPDSVDVLYYLGEAYRLQEKYPQAVEAYTRALSLDAKFAPPHLGLARVLMVDKPEAVEEARLNLEDALRYDAAYADAYLELANLFIRQEDARSALDLLNKNGSLLYNSPLYYHYRAQAYLLEGDFDKALEDARTANALDLTLLEGYRLLGQVQQEAGSLDASISPLETYLRYAPEDVTAMIWLGNAYIDAKQNDQALALFDQALRVERNNPQVLAARAQVYLAEKEWQQSLDDFNIALRFLPDSFSANLGKGRAILGLGYNGDAYIQFNRSEGFAKSDAEKAQLLYWRALSLEGLKEKDPNSGLAAIHDWQSLLALPAESYPEEWTRLAEEHLQALYTQTPTPKPSLTPTPTRTPLPSATATPTLKPTLAPSISATP